MTKIRKAIIPVAGLATRFLPATKAQPKSMLTVVDKPVIQYIVEEAVAAGIEQIIFITGSNQHSVEDHFDSNFELEYKLKEKGKTKELEAVVKATNLASFVFTRQHVPLGDGHAILQAKDLIGLDEAVVVMYGDDVFDYEKSVTAQLIDVYEEYGQSVVALYDVGQENVTKYGIADGEMISDKVMNIAGYVEKPSIEEAPSTLAGVGRYVVTPDIMRRLEKVDSGKDGEIRLADAFTAHLKQGGSVYGRIIDGVRFDCGTKMEFLAAAINFGLKHEEVNPNGEFFDYIKKLASKF